MSGVWGDERGGALLWARAQQDRVGQMGPPLWSVEMHGTRGDPSKPSAEHGGSPLRPLPTLPQRPRAACASLWHLHELTGNGREVYLVAPVGATQLPAALPGMGF